MTSAACHSLTPRIRRAARLTFAGTLAAYLATTGGSMATDVMSYEVTKSMVESRSVAMSYNVHNMDAHRGIDGRYYSPYGIGHPLSGIPFYLLGRAVEDRLGAIGRTDAIRKAVFVTGSAVASALLVWVVFLFAFRLSGHLGAAAWTAVAVAFGSLAWPYSKFGFNAPLATLAVTAGLYACWIGARANRPRMVAVGGLCLAAALLVRHELGLVALAVAVWAAHEYQRDRARTLRFGLIVAIPVAAATILTLYYNVARFGTVWDTGYLREATQTFDAPWDGIVGLLFSPGRSFFLYSLIAIPGVLALVRLFDKDRSTALLLTGVSVLLFLFYASLTWWDADRSFGPRYLLPVVPLVCIPLAPTFAAADAAKRRALTLVLLLSACLQLPGVLVDFSKAGPALGVRHSLEERRWNWRVVSLTINTRAIARFLPDNVRYLAGLAEPPAVLPAEEAETGFSEQFGYSLDFWWLYLFYMGQLSAPAAVTAGGSLLAVAGVEFWRVKKLADETATP